MSDVYTPTPATGGLKLAPYEAPRIEVLGALADMTLGGPGSNCDGHSGTVGNFGNGNRKKPRNC